jgi:hypothetical protein
MPEVGRSTRRDAPPQGAGPLVAALKTGGTNADTVPPHTP